MTRKPLTSVDTAWLRMEDPTNLMMITGVMVFGAPMDFDRFRATIELRLLQFDRFRQRVSWPTSRVGRLCWQDDPDLDLDYHLGRVALAPPGDQAALEAVASELASTPLDFSRPLWQLHLVENYGDGCALVCRLHHAIGDGIALVHVLLSLTDPVADAPLPELEGEKPPRRRRRPRLGKLRAARSVCGTKRRVVRTLVRQGFGMLIHPSRAVDLARVGTRGVTALGTLVLRWPDPKTIFKGPLGVPKRAAWSTAIPLGDVKAVGRGLGGTVNDVLLTAMTGALRRYLVGRGEAVDGLNFRAIVPVDLRPPEVEPDLGNKFGLVFLSLPVGIADPTERLAELKRRMDGIKGSLEAPVAFGILNTIGMSPTKIQDIVVDIFGTKGTAVMTNVIGPRERIFLAGAPLEGLMFWVPQSGHLGLGVSILSYAGSVWMGVITDEGLVPDPETIIAEFHTEFDELLARAHDLSERVASTPETRDRAPRKLAALSAALDEALIELDAMLATFEEPQDDDAESEAAPAPDEPVAGDVDLEAVVASEEPMGGGSAVPAKVVADEPPSRCQATTKAGRQCKNRALPGSIYCSVHQAD